MSSALWFFFLVLCSFLTKLLEINLAFFFHGLEISNRGQTENVQFFPSINHLLQCIFEGSYYSFPQLAKNRKTPYSASNLNIFSANSESPRRISCVAFRNKRLFWSTQHCKHISWCWPQRSHLTFQVRFSLTIFQIFILKHQKV